MVTVVQIAGSDFLLAPLMFDEARRAQLTALLHRLVLREGPVLVVEDDANTREWFVTVGKMGMTAAEAETGDQPYSGLPAIRRRRLFA